jgi:arabinofuranosyltransferase
VGAVNEDAFISFRYAQNLLAGGGLVFNPDGQRVEGITNLLWTFSGAGLPTVYVTLGLACGVLILAWA